jgi:hypothetical protein
VDEIQNDDYASQLRSLRFILGKNFRPISTAALAGITDVAQMAIRGVEAGRRVLNAEDRLAIDIHLGAVWDPESHQWVCVWEEEPGVRLPFTRQRYEFYCQQLIASRTLAVPNIRRLAEALNLLLYNLDEKKGALALLTVHRVILTLAEQNKVNADLIESLQKLDPVLKWKIIKQPGRDKALEDLEDSPGPNLKTASGPIKKKTKTKR